MSADPVEAIARAVLYEGYSLYPYRPSALKNRRRWAPGGIHPRAWVGGDRDHGDRWYVQTECLLVAGERTEVELRVRFLQAQWGGSGGGGGEGPERGRVQEAAEREIAVPRRPVRDWLEGSQQVHPFAFPAGAGASDGSGRRQEAIQGEVVIAAGRVSSEVVRLTITTRNLSDLPAGAGRDEADLRCLWSAHTLLRAHGGELVSLADPPASLREAAAACRNLGTWPALVGPEGARDAMLSAPVILQDHPRVAPESQGDLFDATEIDEILTLRILTLTPEEKRQARESDGRVRALLDRVESLGLDGLGQLHGAVRDVGPSPPRPGDKVRLRPRERADIMDLALAGKVATVVAVMVDFEDRQQVAVTVDDDPGQDLGRAGLPGHRFYFGVHEVEPL